MADVGTHTAAKAAGCFIWALTFYRNLNQSSCGVRDDDRVDSYEIVSRCALRIDNRHLVIFGMPLLLVPH